MDRSTGRMYIHRKYDGSFIERQNSSDLPFDTQEMKISIQISNKKFRGTHALRLLPLEFSGVPPISGYQLLRPERTEHPHAADEKQDELEAKITKLSSSAGGAATGDEASSGGDLYEMLSTLRSQLLTTDYVESHPPDPSLLRKRRSALVRF